MDLYSRICLTVIAVSLCILVARDFTRDEYTPCGMSYYDPCHVEVPGVVTVKPNAGSFDVRVKN